MQNTLLIAVVATAAIGLTGCGQINTPSTATGSEKPDPPEIFCDDWPTDTLPDNIDDLQIDYLTGKMVYLDCKQAVKSLQAYIEAL